MRSRQPNIADVVTSSEQFLRKNRDRLSPKQRDEMERRIEELRVNYDGDYNKVDDWMKESVDRLNQLQKEYDYRVSALRFFSIHHNPLPE